MLSAGWLRAFGKYSYCLYLIHLPVMRAVREYVFDPGEYAMLRLRRGSARCCSTSRDGAGIRAGVAVVARSSRRRF